MMFRLGKGVLFYERGYIIKTSNHRTGWMYIPPKQTPL